MVLAMGVASEDARRFLAFEKICCPTCAQWKTGNWENVYFQCNFAFKLKR